MAEERLILVDENDNPVGTGTKIEVHSSGTLHRAFSIFIMNSRGETLIQRRSPDKYHSGGLWTNACCGHPREGEPIDLAAHRRLVEEMGFDCSMSELFSFMYAAEFSNGLKEHEYDHVFLGFCDRDPVPDANEVAGWKWVAVDRLVLDVEIEGDRFTEWFKLALPGVVEAYKKPFSEGGRAGAVTPAG